MAGRPNAFRRLFRGDLAGPRPLLGAGDRRLDRGPAETVLRRPQPGVGEQQVGARDPPANRVLVDFFHGPTVPRRAAAAHLWFRCRLRCNTRLFPHHDPYDISMLFWGNLIYDTFVAFVPLADPMSNARNPHFIFRCPPGPEDFRITCAHDRPLITIRRY